MPWAVKRTGALGDVILAEPIVRKLAEMFGQPVTVLTAYPQVFAGNPAANTAPLLPLSMYGVIDLDLAYEKHPNMHIVDAYAEQVCEYIPYFTLGAHEKRQRLVFDELDNLPGFDWPRVVTIHPAVSWPSRTLSREVWRGVANGLIERNYIPLFLGGGRDYQFPEFDDLHGCTSLREVAQMIAASACFIGMDSALLHVAGATDTPIAGVFGPVDPRYRLPYGRSDCAVVGADLLCLGCLHSLPPPVTNLECGREPSEKNLCCASITADKILNAFDVLMGAE